jgi:hypothetical protein
MSENTQKQNFRSLVLLGRIPQASQKLKIGPKWYFICDYGKIGIQMTKVLESKTYWRQSKDPKTVQISVSNIVQHRLKRHWKLAFFSPWPPMLGNIPNRKLDSFRVLRLSPIGFGFLNFGHLDSNFPIIPYKVPFWANF